VDGLVLPASAYEGGLRFVDAPIEELRTIVPEYGCPSCDAVFEHAQIRCLACGVALPLSWADSDEERPPQSSTPASLRRAIDAAVRTASRTHAAARIGPELWRIEVPTASGPRIVDLRPCPTSGGVTLRTAVGTITIDVAASLYRHLLHASDEPGTHHRLGVVDDGIYLSRFEPIEDLARGKLAELATSVAQTAAQFAERLAEPFGVAPHR
jgi:hypothetical protein